MARKIVSNGSKIILFQKFSLLKETVLPHKPVLLLDHAFLIPDNLVLTSSALTAVKFLVPMSQTVTIKCTITDHEVLLSG